MGQWSSQEAAAVVARERRGGTEGGEGEMPPGAARSCCLPSFESRGLALVWQAKVKAAEDAAKEKAEEAKRSNLRADAQAREAEDRAREATKRAEEALRIREKELRAEAEAAVQKAKEEWKRKGAEALEEANRRAAEAEEAAERAKGRARAAEASARVRAHGIAPAPPCSCPSNCPCSTAARLPPAATARRLSSNAEVLFPARTVSKLQIIQRQDAGCRKIFLRVVIMSQFHVVERKHLLGSLRNSRGSEKATSIEFR